MRQSQLFIKTKKEAPKGVETISHQLLTRADFIEKSNSGVYRFLPLGFRVLKKIEEIIRREMNLLDGQELYLPALQNKNLWLETKRWQEVDPPLFKFKDRHQKEMALGSTHEEEITDIVRKRVKSYQDLPFSLFQIQDKFRNEMRPSSGLLRTREFLMKDLYSFHSDQKSLENFYQKVKKSYFKIFKRCGLNPICVEAFSGTIGGEKSEEFMVLSETGEDRILICQKCGFGGNIEKIGKIEKCPQCQGKLEKKNCIEIGHIFNLGQKYSQAMKATFLDKNGKWHFIEMGCYGIGLPRLMATIVEVHHDRKGIIWPRAVAPFQVHLIQIEKTKKVKNTSRRLYQELKNSGIEVLYDDRENEAAGEKFAECDLIGIPIRIVISERTIKQNCLELKKRDGKKTRLIKIKSLNSDIGNSGKYVK